MGGYDPYSASKGAVELVASSYRSSYFNNDDYGVKHNTLLASCRAGNVIGGGDWAEDRLIPDIMRAVDKDEQVEIRSPNSTRPWQHVLEPLSGYLLVGQKLLEGKREFAEGWNFGPSDEDSITVKEVVEYIKEYWDKIEYIINEDKNALHEANLLKLDCSKAHFKLGWRARWDSQTTFEKTVTWYREFYEKKSVSSKEQLSNYLKVEM
ncbi:Similar to CDP-glucose 4,6-dehydratase [hydrothermal vent metagenome]|uniref:Similar to CDP-glucose 4,6-dehydratase n=1 Tax=hydrothermal vent metagenome TaxID=652676 RepID=A0A1W1CHN1_9ZZZZ